MEKCRRQDGAMRSQKSYKHIKELVFYHVGRGTTGGLSKQL